MAIIVAPHADKDAVKFADKVLDNWHNLDKLPKKDLEFFVKDLIDAIVSDMYNGNTPYKSQSVDYVEFLIDTYLEPKNEA